VWFLHSPPQQLRGRIDNKGNKSTAVQFSDWSLSKQRDDFNEDHILIMVSKKVTISVRCNSWLLSQRSRVPFPALSHFLSSSGSGTGSTQPL
jgi:hypothetical protein